MQSSRSRRASSRPRWSGRARQNGAYDLAISSRLFFDQELGGVAAVLRDLVLVADVEIADSDKIVGEFGGEFVAGGMLDFESLEIEDVRHGGAGQTVELSGVLNQVFPQPEFVIASIQVMRACSSERRKPRRILLPVSISRLKSLPVRGVTS